MPRHYAKQRRRQRIRTGLMAKQRLANLRLAMQLRAIKNKKGLMRKVKTFRAVKKMKGSGHCMKRRS